MARVDRLDTPGLLHHVIIRGIERRRIFNDNEDRENLIERFSILLPQTKTECYAWVFMPNHAHFLFRSGPFRYCHFDEKAFNRLCGVLQQEAQAAWTAFPK